MENKLYDLGFTEFNYDKANQRVYIWRPSRAAEFTFDLVKKNFIKERRFTDYYIFGGIGLDELKALEDQFKEFGWEIPESGLSLEDLLKEKNYHMEKHKSKDIYYIWIQYGCAIQFRGGSKVFFKGYWHDDDDDMSDRVSIQKIDLDDIEIIKKMIKYLNW